jgi:hypothetical protein
LGTDAAPEKSAESVRAWAGAEADRMIEAQRALE